MELRRVRFRSGIGLNKKGKREGELEKQEKLKGVQEKGKSEQRGKQLEQRRL